MKSLIKCYLMALFALFPIAGSAEVTHWPAPNNANQHSDNTEINVYGATDSERVEVIFKGFQHEAPTVAINYHQLDSNTLYQKVLSEQANPIADLVISSAMPLQYQLANAGLSTPLQTHNADLWPEFAKWRNELFGISFEPIVIVVRKDALQGLKIPESHSDFVELLRTHAKMLKHRVVTYDPELSGTGYTYAMADSQTSARYWELVSALGASNAVLKGNTQDMLDGLASGEYWVGYNLIGSYAKEYVKRHPELMMITPNDYTIFFQRLAMIPKNAPHPEAAKSLLDFLLSFRGQLLLARHTELGSVHPNIHQNESAAALKNNLKTTIRPIAIDPGLLTTLDKLKRKALLTEWQEHFVQTPKPNSAAGIEQDASHDSP